MLSDLCCLPWCKTVLVEKLKNIYCVAFVWKKGFLKNPQSSEFGLVGYGWCVNEQQVRNGLVWERLNCLRECHLEVESDETDAPGVRVMARMIWFNRTCLLMKKKNTMTIMLTINRQLYARTSYTFSNFNLKCDLPFLPISWMKLWIIPGYQKF